MNHKSILFSLLLVCSYLLSLIVLAHINSSLIINNKFVLFVYFSMMLSLMGYAFEKIIYAQNSKGTLAKGFLYSVILYGLVVFLTFTIGHNPNEGIIDFIRIPLSNYLFYILPFFVLVIIYAYKDIYAKRQVSNNAYLKSLVLFVLSWVCSTLIYFYKPILQWEAQFVFQYIIVLLSLNIAPIILLSNLFAIEKFNLKSGKTFWQPISIIFIIISTIIAIVYS